MESITADIPTLNNGAVMSINLKKGAFTSHFLTSSDPCTNLRIVDVTSHSTGDGISLDECEKLVLSPPPVPLNFEVATAAIHAAARRSNSSRTQSISGSTRSLKANKQDGYYDGQVDCSGRSSDHESRKSDQKEIIPKSFEPQNHKFLSKWRRFFCCFPDKPHSTFLRNHGSGYHAGVVQKSKQDKIDLKFGKNANENVSGKKIFKQLKFSKSSPNRTNEPEILKNAEYSDKQIDSSISPTDQVHIPTSTSCFSTVVVSNDHPSLPSTVLNALSNGSHLDSVSSVHIVSVSNGSTLSENELYSYAHGGRNILPKNFVSGNRHNVKPHGIKYHGSNDFYSSKRNEYLEHDLTQRPYPSDGTVISTGDTTTTTTTSTITSTTLVTKFEAAHHVIHQELQAHSHQGDGTSPWLDNDHLDCQLSVNHDQYPVDIDRNGGQGDASSENLDSLSPGMDLLGEIVADCIDKKCLVLDLDETLVHSSFKYVENADFIVPVEINGIIQQVYVRKRPYLDEFLRAVGPLFECVMFTASLRKYADPVCDYIDESSYFRHRLFREACVDHQNNLIKDLSRLGRDVDQICIIDNSPISFLFQPNNALQIVSWFGESCDQALIELIPYLTGLAKAETVVDYLRETRPPKTAAVAQPPTPPWLLLFNPSVSGGLTTMEESDAGDLEDEDMTIDYCHHNVPEEDAIISLHYQ